MNSIIISIGSNIDAENNIALALSYLSEQVGVEKQARLIKTEPIGIINQPQFTNSAVLVSTTLDKEALSLFLKQVEDRCGRDRSRPKFGPREIDLDILVWNGQIVDDDYNTRDFLRTLVHELQS